MPDSQIQAHAAEAAKAGAVCTIALQPCIPFSHINAQAVVASMKIFSPEAPPIVWLRPAHEVNWFASHAPISTDDPLTIHRYIDTNPKNTDKSNKYHGSPQDFKPRWQNVYNAIDHSTTKLFWSPVGPFAPGDTIQSLNATWYPGDAYVDIVGLDAYGQPNPDGSQSTFDSSLGKYYDFYHNKPVALGETGWLKGGTAELRKYWLGQVSGVEARRRCPNYVGLAWFEYEKDGDYRVVMGGAGKLAKGVLG